MRGEAFKTEYDTRLSHVAFKQAWKLMRLAVDTRCEKNQRPFFTDGKRTTAHPGIHSVVGLLVPKLQLPGAECFTGGPGLRSRPVDK